MNQLFSCCFVFMYEDALSSTAGKTGRRKEMNYQGQAVASKPAKVVPIFSSTWVALFVMLRESLRPSTSA